MAGPLPQPNPAGLGVPTTLVIWVMLALGAAAPVAVFSGSPLAGAVTGGIILLAGVVLLTRLARHDREVERARRVRRDRLDRHGRVVRATVIEATQPQVGLVGVGDKHVVQVRIEATLEGGRQQRLSLDCLAEEIEMPRLQPGCAVDLRYDPDDPRNCEITLPPFERARTETTSH